jgi:hypothetical protein|uniref:Uncharacterized protein n=1 Tax=Zea mays TaxID=4577 RepID=B6UHD1_MAIZE|nr:hypothetical protein [Zea mays]
MPKQTGVKANGNLADDETAIRRNWTVRNGDPLVHLHIRQPAPRPRPRGGEERRLVPHRIAKLSWASDPEVFYMLNAVARQKEVRFLSAPPVHHALFIIGGAVLLLFDARQAASRW